MARKENLDKFVLKYAGRIALLPSKYKPVIGEAAEMVKRARRELKYSEQTTDQDIMRTLLNARGRVLRQSVLWGVGGPTVKDNNKKGGNGHAKGK